jgi:uncharacterized repeat protein (TIGR04138 family)
MIVTNADGSPLPSDGGTLPMSLRVDLRGVLARDPRYPIQAYAFVFEALEFSKNLKRRTLVARRTRANGPPRRARHVSGRDSARGARRLALRHYGFWR